LYNIAEATRPEKTKENVVSFLTHGKVERGGEKAVYYTNHGSEGGGD